MAEQAETSKTSDVGQDEIWKNRIEKETKTAKAWPNKWGCLTEVYKESARENLKLKESVKLELPVHLKTRPPTPPEKYIHTGSSPPVPRTTQGMIGWRSSQLHLQLERFGGVHHGRRCFLKQMGWTLNNCP